MSPKPSSPKLRRHLKNLAAIVLGSFLMSAYAQVGAQTQPASSTSPANVDTETAETKTGFGNEGRWFQVEIILFTQTETEREQETWPTNVALAYPPNWKELESISLAEHIDPQLMLDTEPYYKLPEEIRQLNSNLKDLQRSSKHKVLFHEAWRQQVWGIDEAPSLLITGGSQYGNHFELEGSINLSVARYLHLKTNLWFTEFQHNYGQEASDYPPLPPKPSRTPTETETLFDSTEKSPWDNIQIVSNEYEKILDEPYVSTRVITMKQKRRMRSKEIHYVDHPVIGMIVYITPYELPEVEPEVVPSLPEGVSDNGDLIEGTNTPGIEQPENFQQRSGGAGNG